MTTILTQQTIIATRQHFADLDDACIAEVMSGEVRVNDQAGYFQWRNESKADGLAGKHDHTLTFLQYAHYLQTGNMIALLS